MKKRYLPLIALLTLSLCAAAQSHKKASAGPAPDKADMQKVLDGWSTLNPADAAKFYAPGPGTFFDVTPLKYASWEEYEAGVRKVLTNYQGIKFTLNDDAVVHAQGDCAWGTTTLKEDALLKNGKHELATLRWTVIWEKRDGKWLIVHDHTSEPLQ
jgi:ketosteroid isomerase-like protein